MQTTLAAPGRRHNPWTTGLLALSLLALLLLLAAPAQAQRGGHGGRGNAAGGPHGSGHYSGDYGQWGQHRGAYGRYGHGSYRENRGGYATRDSHGYGRYFGPRYYGPGYWRSGDYGRRYGKHSSYGYGGFYGYLGYRPGVFGGYAYYDPRVYGAPYAAYGGPAYSWDEAPDPGAYLGYDYSQDPAELYQAPEPEAVPPAGETEAGGPFDARLEPARVDFRVEPGDASVYLDGRFVGLAAELPETLLIEAGDHLVEVVRPGFASREVELRVAPGEELELDARLEPAGRRR